MGDARDGFRRASTHFSRGIGEPICVENGLPQGKVSVAELDSNDVLVCPTFYGKGVLLLWRYLPLVFSSYRILLEFNSVKFYSSIVASERYRVAPFLTLWYDSERLEQLN